MQALRVRDRKLKKRRASTEDVDSIGGHNAGALRWLLTYSDMITLLMAFFIMLYSMSILSTSKFNQVAVSLKSGFSGMVNGKSRSIVDGKGKISIKTESEALPEKTMAKLAKLANDGRLSRVVKLREDERGIIISLAADKVLFSKSGAVLTPGAKKVLSPVASILKDLPNQVCVEGHTCDLPIASHMYPSNWELSSARASSVVRYFIRESGISPDRLCVSGYANYKPIVKNNSEKNRAINRRVDIVVLRTAM